MVNSQMQTHDIDNPLTILENRGDSMSSRPTTYRSN